VAGLFEEAEKGRWNRALKRKKLGFLINPIAGMGGRVGLKGTDGREILEKAIALGARPWAGERAKGALRPILGLKDEITLVTYPSQMGEDAARDCGFLPKVLKADLGKATTATETKHAARAMLDEKVDLLLFAGGDGTARDSMQRCRNIAGLFGYPGRGKNPFRCICLPSYKGRRAGSALLEEISPANQGCGSDGCE